jgi:hypothetical protein
MSDEGPTTAATLIAKFKGDKSDVMETIRAVRAAAIELGATDTTINIDTKGAAKSLAEIETVRTAAERLGYTDDKLFAAQKRVNDENTRGLQRWQLITLAIVALIPLLGPLLGYSIAIAGGLAGMGVAGVAAVVGIRQEMLKGTKTGDEYSAGLRILKSDLDQLGHTAAVNMLHSYDNAISLIQRHMPELNKDTAVFSRQLGTTGTLITSGVLTALQALLPLLLTGGVYVERLGFGFQQWTENGGIQKFANYALNVLPQVASTLGQLVKLVTDIVIASAPWGTVVLGALDAVAKVLDTFPTPVLGGIAAGAVAGYAAFKLWKGVDGGIDAVRAAMAAVNSVMAANIPLTQAEMAANAEYVALLATEPGILEAVTVAEGDAAVGATAMGGAMDFATGPGAVLFATLGALAAIITVAVSATTVNTKATEDYTAAVQQDAGALGEHIRAQAAANLQKAGAFAEAKRLGIATKTLTDATVGSTSAESKLKTELAAATTKLKESELALQQNSKATGDQIRTVDANRTALKNLTAEYQSNKTSIKDAIKAYNDIQHALGGTTISTRAQFDAQQELANKYGLSLPAFLNATDAQKKHADQAAATTAELQQENDAATLLTNAFTLLNGGSLSVAQAQTGVAAANNAVTDSFKQNGLVIEGNTKAAVANQQAVQAQVASAQQAAEAIANQTKSSAAGVKAYQDSKDQLEQNLRAQGLLTDATQAYIDKLYDVADFKPAPTKLDIDDAAARKKLADWAAYVKQTIPTDLRLSVKVATDAAGGTAGHAAGGTAGFAQGGNWGTVLGAGSTTSDSIATRLSLDEEVIRASSARQVRPLLKAINKDPYTAVAEVMAMGARAARKTEINHHWGVITQGDPRAAIRDAMRQSEARAA